MIDKWLHLNESGGAPWVLPIWNAVNIAVQAGNTQKPSDEIYRLGPHISIRLNILPRVVRRVNANTTLLYESVKVHGDEYVFTEDQEGYAFPVDNDLKYELLADIDALLFEINATWELMKRLFGLLHDHVGRPIAKKDLGKEIGKVLSQNNWFKLLDNHRNLFMHEGAPYIAVDLSKEPESFDLLIMKENIKFFSDPDTFVSLSEINSIVQGFAAARQQLQDYLVSLFRELKTEGALNMKFSHHAVVYLDILGFKNFVENAEKDPGALQQLNKLFSEVIPREILPDGKNSNYPEAFGMKCLNISDSFIVSAPISEHPTHPALVVVSMKAIQIAHALLDMGLLVRGAIAVGNVYRTDSNIMGTAYQKAVDGEKNAVNPQIVLTESAEKNLDEFNEKREFKYAIFAKNELGEIILNAIYPEQSYLPDLHGDVNDYFKKYRVTILENLSHEDQKARAKWLWFAGLFDANVRFFSEIKDKSLAIDQELLSITINYLNPPPLLEDNFKWAKPFVAQGVVMKINTDLIKPG
ncbi:MAG: hypothetical protein ACYC0M_10555 [Burkholderiales bacterium]